MNDKESYLGNKNLKKSDVALEFSKDQVKEYIKCYRDPVYFIENYIKIVHVDRGLIQFKPYDFQKDIVNLYQKERFVICKMPRQVGKALHIDTPILTPNGFKTMGDIQEGDYVYGSNGKPTRVKLVSRVMKYRPCYKITFRNNEEIIADEEHLWNVSCPDWKNEIKTLTTKQLLDVIQFSNKPFIKMSEPLEFEKRELNFDPYLYGLWVGGARPRYISNIAKTEDLDFYYNNFTVLNHLDNVRFTGRHYLSLKEIQENILVNKKLKNKIIDEEIMFSSFEDRLQFIRGIMDSCGENIPNKRKCYMKISWLQRHNVEKIRFILSSLGIKSSIRENFKCTLIIFRTDMSVFTMPRKKDAQSTKFLKEDKRFYFKSIEKVESVPVKCIKVESQDQLFLAGNNLIPTHNTTIVAGIILHSVLFNENYSVAILANKEKQAQEILGRIQLAYEHLPKWLQQGIMEWNKKSIDLENGSKILASSTASSAIRGTSQNLVYLDEFAFVPNNIQEEFFASVYPTISSGETTKILITSTPNGLNMFYKLWVDSEEGRNDFKRIDVHWSEVPGRDEQWKEETIRNTSEKQFLEEFECEFLGSSGTLIDGRILGRLTYNKPETENDNFKLYYPPRTTGFYVIAVDVSRGLGNDYSAFVVFDASEVPYKVVATYRSNTIEPMMLPEIIYSAAKKFNDAYVIIEINDIGQQVSDILHFELEYENIFYTAKSFNNNTELSAGFKSGSLRGLRTTKQTKKLGCSNLKSLIENNKLLVSDYQILYELQRFCVVNGSYAAEEGNDDLVMCLVFFAWVTTQQYFKETLDIDIRKKLLIDKEKELEESIPGFGFIDDKRYIEDEPVVTVSEFDKFLLS